MLSFDQSQGSAFFSQSRVRVAPWNALLIGAASGLVDDRAGRGG
jgi:hypothetical protein